MTGTTDGTGGGSGMTHEQMERDARKVIFAQGVGSARGVGNPAIERAIPQARNVLSLLEEVERSAISSGQIHDKWETITIRNETISLNNLRWWQFWRPKFQEFRLDLSMEVSGPVNVASVKAQLTPEGSRDD